MRPELKSFVQTWLINTLAVLITAHVVDGIDYDTPTALLVATLLLGILNAVVRPLLVILSLPLLVLTLGIFYLVINAGLLWFVGELVKGFHVATFWAACKGALLIVIINLIINFLTGTGGTRIRVSRGRRRSRRASDEGGPMIDV